MVLPELPIIHWLLRRPNELMNAKHNGSQKLDTVFLQILMMTTSQHLLLKLVCATNFSYANKLNTPNFIGD